MSAQHAPGPRLLSGPLAGKDPADMSAVELQSMVYALNEQNNQLLSALRRLSFAAASRENSMGDVCSLLAAKAELADAAKNADAVIRGFQAGPR